jgi:hypothetical protein
MNFQALIEFNKYTLALAAGCFAYTLEKFVPVPSDPERPLVLAVLGVFFVCALLAVIIFAAATAAQHPKKAAHAETIAKLIAPLGIGHTFLLIAGLFALGWLLYGRVVGAPEAPKPVACCVVEGTCAPRR